MSTLHFVTTTLYFYLISPKMLPYLYSFFKLSCLVLKGNSTNFTHGRQFISHEISASKNICMTPVSQNELCQA